MFVFGLILACLPQDGTEDQTAEASRRSTQTIYKVQKGLISVDSAVTLRGMVVTSPVVANGFFIAQPKGGLYSGIWVYAPDASTLSLPMGSKVDVSGTVAEYFDKTEIVSSAAQIVRVGSARLPPPLVLQSTQLSGDLEPYEGVVVQVLNGSAATVSDRFGEWSLSLPPTTLLVSDLFFPTSPAVGAAVDRITGPLDYSFSTFKIQPRGAADIAFGTIVDPCAVDTDGDGFDVCEDCDDTDPSRGLTCSTGGSTELDCQQAGFGSLATTPDRDLEAALQNLMDQPSCSYDAARDFMFGVLDNTRPGAGGDAAECVYTGQVVTYSDGQLPDNATMNTEHTWPQSWGSDSSPRKCDLHHLYPTLSPVNSDRGNLSFREVVSITDTYPGGSLRGRDAGGRTVFEPRDSHKGNVARAMLYHGLQYGDLSLSDGDGLSEEEMNLYASWDAADPVTEEDILRSNLTAAEQRSSDNPFVVCPGLVQRFVRVYTSTH